MNKGDVSRIASLWSTWVQADRHLVGFHKGEHVGQDGGVHGQAGRVGGVGDDAEHVLEDVGVVSLVEALRRLRTGAGHVLQELVEDAETRVGDVSHRVLKGPNDGVQDQLELSRRNGEKCSEAVIVDGLE